MRQKGAKNMFDANKFRSKVAEKGLNMTEVARLSGIEKSTLYRKIANKDGSFTVKEVAALAKVLELSAEDINSIFFAELVA